MDMLKEHGIGGYKPFYYGSKILDLADCRAIVNLSLLTFSGDYAYGINLINSSFCVYFLDKTKKKYTLKSSISIRSVAGTTQTSLNCYSFIISSDNKKAYLSCFADLAPKYYMLEIDLVTMTKVDRLSASTWTTSLYTPLYADSIYVYYYGYIGGSSKFIKALMSDFSTISSVSGSMISGNGTSLVQQIKYYCKENNTLYIIGNGSQLINSFQAIDLTNLSCNGLNFPDDLRNNGSGGFWADGTYYYTVLMSPTNYDGYLVKGLLSNGSKVATYSSGYSLTNTSNAPIPVAQYFLSVELYDRNRDELWVRTSTKLSSYLVDCTLVCIDRTTLKVKDTQFIGGYPDSSRGNYPTTPITILSSLMQSGSEISNNFYFYDNAIYKTKVLLKN